MIPKLEVDGISYSYHLLDGKTLVLDHMSFDVPPGEFLTIVEPFGCGKSTPLSMLCGLIQPEGGTISIGGIPLTKSPSTIGYMPQKDHLLEWRNTFSNISLGLEIQKRLDEPARQGLLEVMVVYGLAGFEYVKLPELSGGMRQRAALTRTLAPKPDFLLLDEPFPVLDYQTRLSVCDDISSIIRQIHKTAILATHDLSEAINVTDRMLVLPPCPGRVRKILSIGFPKVCTRSLDRRNCPEFSTHFNVIWKELKIYG